MYEDVDEVMDTQIEELIKYFAPGIEICLPTFTNMEYKTCSSRIWPDRNIEADRPNVMQTLLPGPMVSPVEKISVGTVHTPRLGT